MLMIRLNGREEKLNIGCRTFVSLDVLLKSIKAGVNLVVFYGEPVRKLDFPQVTVKGGDVLLLQQI